MVVLGGRGGRGGGRNNLSRGGKARPVVPRRIHMSVTRWQAILLATAIVTVPILSCSQRSLVLVTINAPQGVAYTDVSLVITANGVEQTTFGKASFTGGVYKAGVYLPSDMSGKVPFSAEVVQNDCKIAMGGPVESPDVSSGATVSLTIGLNAEACVPVDGGAGSSGTGGGTGRGGSGTGGVVGSGGVTTGSGGVVGSSGVVGSGGVVGTGGAVGSGGTGGRGGSGSGGIVGTGGVNGTGGRIGTGGIIGTGGVKGTGGIVGTGGIIGTGGGGGKGGGSGSGGTTGTGGLMGSGGTSGCSCPNANKICQPASNTCVCSQSDSAACANAACGSVTNICMQTVSSPNTCPTGYVCDTTLNSCTKLVVTGCGGSVTTGTGLVAGTQAAPICP